MIADTQLAVQVASAYVLAAFVALAACVLLIGAVIGLAQRRALRPRLVMAAAVTNADGVDVGEGAA